MATRLVLVPLTTIVTAVVMAVHTPAPKPIVVVAPIVINQAPYPPKGSLSDFLDAVANRESNNNIRVVNRYGYMGKYQFSITTLHALGPQFRISRYRFLRNGDLQDSAMVEYLKQNKRYLQDIIDQYDGTWYDGTYITESGILAGAHLIGPVSVKAFFNPQYRTQNVRTRTKDANGTSVQEYLRAFSGYSLRELD